MFFNFHNPDNPVNSVQKKFFRAACEAGVFVSRRRRGFVSRASDADRRSRRRGGDGRRSHQRRPVHMKRTERRRDLQATAAPRRLKRRSRASDAPRFVLARQRQKCQHRSCRDYCFCINISLHPRRAIHVPSADGGLRASLTLPV